MTWHLIEDPDEFAEAAGEFLRSRPVEHTVLLTLIDKLRQNGLHTYGPDDPIFGYWRAQSGPVTGVLLQTPPFPIMFSALPPEAVPAAAQVLADHPLPGANLPADAADAFTAEWTRHTGATAKIGMRTRLYRLGTLTPPAPLPPGAARQSGTEDRELLQRFVHAFYAAIGQPTDAITPLPDDVTLWTTPADRVVSMASRSRPNAGMVRIQHVYTPPEFRGQGFAGAVTAAATQAALLAGATEVVLFTDLANPTTNSLYQRLGYRPVEDRSVMEFWL